MGMHAVILNGTSSHRSLSPSPKESPGPTPADTNEIFEHVSVLSEQVRAVLAIKSTLEVQHVAAQATIQALEKKVEALKAIVKSSHEQLPPLPSIQPPLTLALNELKESISEILSKWKKSVQGQWSLIQEEWSQEREQLNCARVEFELKTQQMNEGISNLESTVSEVQQAQSTQGHQLTTLQTWMIWIQDSTGWFWGGDQTSRAMLH